MFEDNANQQDAVSSNVPARYAFGYRLAQVVGKEPEYYQLLVADEPTRKMWDLVDSLALEGDPEHPDTALLLFQEFSQGVVQEQADRWLAGLQDAARNLYRNKALDDSSSLSARMMRMIYADPSLYELMAASEPGFGLLEIIESLAVDGDAADLEDMLRLIKQCSVT
jgi:hypothetical protein